MSNKKSMFYVQQEKTHDLGDALPTPIRDVLMLDDEEDFSDIIKAYLAEHHYRVTSVKSGIEGLKKIMVADYDLILCDMLMPGLPGDMFYLAVEKTKPQLCKRFIFMTGHQGDKKIDQFIRSVRGVMMWKPFRPDDLLSMMQTVLRKNDME